MSKMNIRYCNPNEWIEGHTFPSGYAGYCGVWRVWGEGGKWKPEVILIDKNLKKGYAKLTLVHELGHWFLYKIGFFNHWIWEWFWYRCVRFFYGKGMYKKASK